MTDNEPTRVTGLGLTIPPGTRLNGIFEIERQIGSGGMGMVYRAHNVETKDAVAIKIVRAEMADNAQVLALFRREAAVLHRLLHDAIVRYYLFSSDQTIGRPYLATEFVDGTPLSAMIDRAPLPRDEVLSLAERLADGLQAAHDLSIFHRDISPDNIILPDRNVTRAKIIDFGIAKAASVGGGTVIGDSIAGKFDYMSPEQLGLYGAAVDGRSDIYSLGIVLSEAIRGRGLDMGGTQLEVVEKRRKVPDVGDIDANVRTLLTAMMQPKPDDRVQTMAEVAERAHALRTGKAQQSGGGFKKIAAGLVVLAAVGGGAAWYISQDGDPVPPERVPPPLQRQATADPSTAEPDVLQPPPTTADAPPISTGSIDPGPAAPPLQPDGATPDPLDPPDAQNPPEDDRDIAALPRTDDDSATPEGRPTAGPQNGTADNPPTAGGDTPTPGSPDTGDTPPAAAIQPDSVGGPDADSEPGAGVESGSGNDPDAGSDPTAGVEPLPIDTTPPTSGTQPPPGTEPPVASTPDIDTRQAPDDPPATIDGDRIDRDPDDGAVVIPPLTPIAPPPPEVSPPGPPADADDPPNGGTGTALTAGGTTDPATPGGTTTPGGQTDQDTPGGTSRPADDTQIATPIVPPTDDAPDDTDPPQGSQDPPQGTQDTPGQPTIARLPDDQRPEIAPVPDDPIAGPGTGTIPGPDGSGFDQGLDPGPEPDTQVPPIGSLPPPGALDGLDPDSPFAPAGEPEHAVVRFVRNSNLGPCTYLRPTNIGEESAAIEAYGAEIPPFEEFYNNFSRSMGFDANVNLQLITEAQCPAIDFADALVAHGEGKLRFKIDKDIIRAGDVLSGAITGIEGRDLIVYLVASDGRVYDLGDHFTRGRDDAALHTVMSGSSGSNPSHLIVAIAGDALPELANTPIADAPGLIDLARELSQRDDSEVAVSYFKYEG